MASEVSANTLNNDLGKVTNKHLYHCLCVNHICQVQVGGGYILTEIRQRTNFGDLCYTMAFTKLVKTWAILSLFLTQGPN